MPIDNDVDMTTLESETRHILDSGARKEYVTGAVRDIHEGKGRCDLLPLTVIGNFIEEYYPACQKYAFILYDIDRFRQKGQVDCLAGALYVFFEKETIYNHSIYTFFLELSKHFEEGALKYGDDNWQKGIPIHCYIDSGIRHLFKHARGDTDEPHDRAFAWNLFCAIWTMLNIPEMDDFTVVGKKSRAD